MARILYFDDQAPGGANNSEWGTLANWWDNEICTDPAASLPAPADSVVILQNVQGGTVSVANLDAILDVAVALTTLNVSGLASFTADNADNQSEINGNCLFAGGSMNSGTINGDCTFNEGSSNHGVINGDCTFNDFSRNTEYGSVTPLLECNFLGTSINAGMVNGTAVFQENAYNSYMDGPTVVTGSASPAIFKGDYYPSAWRVRNGGSGTIFDPASTVTVLITADDVSGSVIDISALSWEVAGELTIEVDGSVVSLDNGTYIQVTVVGMGSAFVIFNSTSFSGTVYHPCEFKGTSMNYGLVSGDGSTLPVNGVVLFSGYGVFNYGSVYGDCLFSGPSTGNAGVIYGNAEFSGSASGIDGEFAYVTGNAELSGYNSYVTGGAGVGQRLTLSGTDAYILSYSPPSVCETLELAGLNPRVEHLRVSGSTVIISNRESLEGLFNHMALNQVPCFDDDYPITTVKMTFADVLGAGLL